MDELKGRGTKTWRSAMILPAHQDAIDAWYASQHDVSKPILSHDRIDEINQAILFFKSKRCLVKLSYYNDRKILDIKGIIHEVDPLQKRLTLLQENNVKVSILLNLITDICDLG